MTTEDKNRYLQDTLRTYGTLAVAFSGGVDSCFLLKTAQLVLGERVLALTVDSVFVPRDELNETIAFCRDYGIRQILVQVDVLSIPEVVGNPPDRCYHCKRALFQRMKEIAHREGFRLLAEGSNTDDDSDYRPGRRAVAELEILCPLKDAGLNKAEIRELSRQLGLAGWNKPSQACLASRVPYEEALSEEKLGAIEQAEKLLHSLGFRQCRVRAHRTLARIEIPPDDFERILTEGTRNKVSDALINLGFAYVTLDLVGFRSGSMNEVLKK